MATNAILTQPPKPGKRYRLTDRQVLTIAQTACSYIANGTPWAVTFDPDDLEVAINRLAEIIKGMEVESDGR